MGAIIFLYYLVRYPRAIHGSRDAQINVPKMTSLNYASIRTSVQERPMHNVPQIDRRICRASLTTLSCENLSQLLRASLNSFFSYITIHKADI